MNKQQLLRTLTLIFCLVAFVFTESNGQTQRRRISLDFGYSAYQKAVNATEDFVDAEEYEPGEETNSLTFGLTYRFTKRMSLYGEYTKSNVYLPLDGPVTAGQQQFSAMTIGWMPLSGFFEFGLGYTRLMRELAPAKGGSAQIGALSEETLSAANLRLRFDIKLFEGLSVYSGASIYGVLPNSDQSDIDLLGNVNVGVQVYLLGKEKRYLSRRERKAVRKLQRERDLEDLQTLEDQSEAEKASRKAMRELEKEGERVRKEAAKTRRKEAGNL